MPARETHGEAPSAGKGRGSRKRGELPFAATSLISAGTDSATSRVHATFPLFPAAAERDAVRGADRLAPPDAAGRHDPPGSGRHLRLAAAGLPGAEKDRQHRARGNEPRRRHRNADAHAAARRSVERNAAATTPMGRRCCASRTVTSASCFMAPPTKTWSRKFSAPMCARTGRCRLNLYHIQWKFRDELAPAFRRHARPRIPDEGRLFLRSRRSGRTHLL